MIFELPQPYRPPLLPVPECMIFLTAHDGYVMLIDRSQHLLILIVCPVQIYPSKQSYLSEQNCQPAAFTVLICLHLACFYGH